MNKANTLDAKYLAILKEISDKGFESGDRTGTGTKKLFGRMITHDMKEGFPLLTTKKMFWKGILIELLWFLKGDTNIKYLVDNGVNIWVGDCYKKYVHVCSANSSEFNDFLRDNNDGTLSLFTEKEFIEQIKTNHTFAREWGNLGTVYGKEWVDWYGINQVKELVDTLKTNPNNRRMMVTAWNPVHVKTATLPPCHYAWQVFTRELTLGERISIAHKYITPDNFLKIANKERLDAMKVPEREISLMFQMRSVDMPLGYPFDIASYGFLLSMIAQCVNMEPGQLVSCTGDTHIYMNQLEFIDIQMNNEPYELPTLLLNKNIKDLFDFTIDDVKIVNYQSHDKISYPLSN